MSQGYLAKHRGSPNWGDRKSNQLKCWYLVRGENQRTRGKASRSNPHLTSDPGIEPRPHWWKTSALTTAPTLLPPNGCLQSGFVLDLSSEFHLG